MTSASEQLFAEAQRYIPGGVDSPVRAFKGVGGIPPFLKRGLGAHVFDADGREYIDYVCSWGPLILGHAHPGVVAALTAAVDDGTSFGAPTELETTLAKMVVDAVPSIEMVRFVNSGTEACMSALRVARAFANRDKIIKFEGCYHGHADGLLVKAGSGAATFGQPDSAGVPAAYAGLTLVAHYNSLDSVQALLQANDGEVAALIVEPIAGNMGVVPPAPGFLQGLRSLCDEAGVVLIFDEVISGFRAAYGGAQALYGVTPDLTCLGKIIGGGLPVGAYGGRREIMEQVAPLGPAYQAGTLSGNPLAMTAGIETLRQLSRPGVYDLLETLGCSLQDGLDRIIRERAVPATTSRVGSLITLFFNPGPIVDYPTAAASDSDRFAAYFHGMLKRGCYLAPSQFEALFLSLSHTEQDIQQTLEAAAQAIA